MRRPHSLGFTLAATYTGLFLLAVAYIVWRSVFTPGQFELAGVFIFLLGLPWSLILTFIVLALKSSSAWLLAIGYIFSCILNALLLYKLGALLQRGSRR
jgi:FtsH-binding integral membrane protein